MLARKRTKTFSGSMRFVGKRVYPADSYFVLLELEWDGPEGEDFTRARLPPAEGWEKEDR